MLQLDAVLALRAELGEDMYHYALYRGRYELGSVRRFFAAMRKPVSGRGGLEQEPAAQGSLGQLCRRHGVMALRLVAVSWPEALVARFARNLPGLAGLPEEALPDLDEAERDEIWRAVKKLLLKEVAPSWAPCFD